VLTTEGPLNDNGRERLSHLQEVDEVKQHKTVQWRKLIDEVDAGVDLMAVSYSSQVEAVWNERIRQLPEPEFQQRRRNVGISRLRRLGQKPLVAACLHGVHFIQVARQPETRRNHCQRLIDQLGFNGIFSTNRLHCAFEKYVAV